MISIPNKCSNDMLCICTDMAIRDMVARYVTDKIDSRAVVEQYSREMKIYFESDWEFPMNAFEGLADKLRKKGGDKIAITILSVEWGCLYAKFVIWNGKRFK